MTDFSDNLKAWRKKDGITQKAAAKALGCSERYYQGLEGGGYIPSSIMIKLVGIVTKKD